MITKTEIDRGRVGNKEGWCYAVYWDNRPYPNLISGIVKTELGAKRALGRYLKTGKILVYGNAER